MNEVPLPIVLHVTAPRKLKRGETFEVLLPLTLFMPAQGDARIAPAKVGRGPKDSPAPHAGEARNHAFLALVKAKVRHPDALLKTYVPERILEVVYAALHADPPKGNIPGFINAALRQGWNCYPKPDSPSTDQGG